MPSSVPFSKPLDPSAASFQPNTAGGGGHLPPLVIRTPSAPPAVVSHLLTSVPDAHSPPPVCLPHQLYAHPPHFQPHVFYAPTTVPCYVLFSSFCWYYSLPLPAAPSNRPGFHPISPIVRKQVHKRSRDRATQKIWVRKNGDVDNAGRQLPAKATRESEAKLKGLTSLMIRNIPNQLDRGHLEEILDRHCREENKMDLYQAGFRKSAYDFLYLPMDFGFKLNMGYGFVNFTSAEAAMRFYDKFNNLEWSFADKRKICEICPALLQGKDALRKSFERSVFNCERKDYLPAVYSPARDGSIRPKPTTLGRCTGRQPARDGGAMLTTLRKLGCSGHHGCVAAAMR